MTHETRTILGVVCTTVHDTSTINGELAEDTRDYFAQDKQGNVWYFGENSLELAGGLVVSTEGIGAFARKPAPAAIRGEDRAK